MCSQHVHVKHMTECDRKTNSLGINKVNMELNYMQNSFLEDLAGTCIQILHMPSSYT